jgi:hypothetical protein
MNPTLINHDQAVAFVLSIKDPITRGLTSLVVRSCELSLIRGEKPEHDFDMLHFAKVVAAALSQHETIKSLLSGDDILW